MPIRKSNDTLFYLIGIVPVVWLALLLAQSLGGGLPELLRNLTSALEQPTNIVWTDKSLPTILICLAAYGMAVLLYPGWERRLEKSQRGYNRLER